MTTAKQIYESTQSGAIASTAASGPIMRRQYQETSPAVAPNICHDMAEMLLNINHRAKSTALSPTERIKLEQALALVREVWDSTTP